MKANYIILFYSIILSYSCYSNDEVSKVIDFKNNRDSYIESLSLPVKKCINRHDTSHPLFHGCIDWHSSVHAFWSLIAVYDMTDNDIALRSLKKTFSTELVEQEYNFLKSNPQFEMPYGRSWFLRLAIAYRNAYGEDLNISFSNYVATSLIQYLESINITPQSDSYDSVSWALINLYDYAHEYNKEVLLLKVERIIEEYFIVKQSNKECPVLEIENLSTSFMAVCTNWAMLVGKILDKREFEKWINEFMPKEKMILPINTPNSIHNYGTNFSRSWGFWSIYQKTENIFFFEKFLEHFFANFNRPEWWKRHYKKGGHWVAQFGLFSLISTYN